ncbi:MAG: hypothetical protein J5U19_08465 [Candidatus Methanoperedens sp.]|nr:hypothetical protein [Candidatus Methanoperedens sp.]
MRFLFGDSTEFQMQIDFLRLLNNFLEISVKTIKLENAVFNLKETIIDRRRVTNSVTDEMDNFILTVENAIDGAVARSKEQETIVKYAEKSKEFIKKHIEDGKTKITEEILQEITQFERKIEEADEENRKLLESFFIYDPIPVIGKKYTIKAIEKGYSAKVQVNCKGGISCLFDLTSFESPFWKGHVRTRDFVKGVEIPARMKKPFLKKELVPDIVSMDDFLLSDLILSDRELEVVFWRRPDIKAEQFRLKMTFNDEFSVNVSHAEENDVEKNIIVVPELKNELNILRLQELGRKIVEQTNNLYPKKQRLDTILLEGKDVFGENLVFLLMQKVAEIFAPTVAEIKKHSPSGEELSLKSEDEHGTRHEIYLKKSEVREKLDTIEEKGGKLFELLGIK